MDEEQKIRNGGYRKNREFAEYYKKSLSETVGSLDSEKLIALSEIILKTRDSKGTLFLVGNGGSASIAAHFAHNLNWDASALLEDRKRFRAVALHENLCHLTGLANDRHYDQVFVEQLRNFLQPNDIVIGISASGNSDSVLEAIKFAKSRKNFSIALVGNNGGKIAGKADISYIVPSQDQQITEDASQAICHLIVRMLFYKEKGFEKNHLPFADIAHLRDKQAYLESRRRQKDASL